MQLRVPGEELRITVWDQSKCWSLRAALQKTFSEHAHRTNIHPHVHAKDSRGEACTSSSPGQAWAWWLTAQSQDKKIWTLLSWWQLEDEFTVRLWVCVGGGGLVVNCHLSCGQNLKFGLKSILIPAGDRNIETALRVKHKSLTVQKLQPYRHKPIIFRSIFRVAGVY